MDMISMGITKRGMTDLDMIIKVTTMRDTTKKGTTNSVKIKLK